ncbi:unnamed protein product [Gongylonema pulchrum]|uniref:RNase H type-1 domain-containing protein n=1 Tax=Gongylonema pulchrum TaxID=637853 RepID=A0A3P7MWG5_9BILA|nr:unnamed protein product [Gongylonema pulchrum]
MNKSKTYIGREHTSAFAEILAVKVALRSVLRWEYFRGEKVILRTDFLSLVDAMRSNRHSGRFYEDYEELKALAHIFPHGVQFEHVFGHEGEYGNEQRLEYSSVKSKYSSYNCKVQALGEKVILRTDFLSLVDAMRSNRHSGRFYEDYEELKALAHIFPHGVQFEHVFGHEGEYGNEQVT